MIPVLQFGEDSPKSVSPPHRLRKKLPISSCSKKFSDAKTSMTFSAKINALTKSKSLLNLDQLKGIEPKKG